MCKRAWAEAQAGMQAGGRGGGRAGGQKGGTYVSFVQIVSLVTVLSILTLTSSLFPLTTNSYASPETAEEAKPKVESGLVVKKGGGIGHHSFSPSSCLLSSHRDIRGEGRGGGGGDIIEYDVMCYFLGG